MNIFEKIAESIGAKNEDIMKFPSLQEFLASLKDASIPVRDGGHQSSERPGYDESDGLAGAYEYTPRAHEAVQFLPHNVPYVMEFLYDWGVPFGYTVTRSGESKILLMTGDSKFSLESNELAHGRWVVVTGSREQGNLACAAVDDEQFRRMFRPTAKGSAPAASAEDELRLNADSLLDDAEQDALSAYDNG